MFEPEEKRRSLRQRSLLDFVASEEPRAAAYSSKEIPYHAPPRSERPVLGEWAAVGASDSQVPLDDALNQQKRPANYGWRNWWPWRKRSGDVDTASEDPFDERVERRESGDRPLLDLGILLQTIWRWRYIIAATTLLGALAAAYLAMVTPNRYVAETRLYVDPREFRLTDTDLSQQTLSTEALLAVIDSQLQVLSSRTVLEKVAQSLQLQNDPEFIANGTPASNTVIEAQTLENLEKAVTVSRDARTFVVAVQVMTRDPQKSARIANTIVETFLNEESAVQSGFFERTTNALDSRITELRKNLDAAENEVEKYKADNDLVGAGGTLITDRQLVTLNDQAAAARNRLTEASAKADTVSKIGVNDVLTGAFPEEASSLALVELRKQYTALRSQLGGLSATLGARHPQRQSVQQSVSALENEIRNELRRIVTISQTELTRARAAYEDLTGQLAAQKTRQIASSSSLVKLRELERNANATRTIYESFLKLARETGEEEKLTSKNIRVISTAEPPLKPSFPPRKLFVAGGTLGGLLLGLGLAVLFGIYRSLTQPPPVYEPMAGGYNPYGEASSGGVIVDDDALARAQDELEILRLRVALYKAKQERQSL